MDAFKNLNTSSINRTLSSISPLARRTAQLVRQTIGTADDITELPAEYIDLEQSVDSLKTIHVKLLSVTSTYSNVSYDYPANLRETFSELSKTIQEKVHNLASAQSATEIQAAIMKPATKSTTKTLNHALSRAALASSECLNVPCPLKELLYAYSEAQDKIGNARLEQDQQIVAQFNNCLAENLGTIFQYSAKARKNVNVARLSLDAIKSSAKSSKPEKKEQMQSDVEHAEDAFVAAVEEATQIMKNTLETPELISQLKNLISAQCSFYKEAYEILSNLLNEDLLKNISGV
ncbi:hypothetical protein PORY_000511 [Pneumocystis oryctolagi]|uniref:Uncharacterized protein n=1 Tax=Pneumocystis oryctolagi TaxID=42067 RepID=A0ACB7CFV8_9ASCO|nr:hypothetical protein PORY_000511 [Pneumocystis oryctolagi]